MSRTQENNKKIAKNTLFLYIRSIIILTVSIYTSRVVLAALGINDYGIYNIVGGFVSVFSILSSSLVNASQRFISYEMGKACPETGKVFSSALTVHVVLAIVVFVLIESIGLWFLNYKINISPDRIYAANWVFHCSALTFSINLINIPFTATIIAHERMDAFAYIGIFEVCAKLAIVYILFSLSTDKLITYAVLMVLVVILLATIYVVYCGHCFQECVISFHYDRKVVGSMLSFSGWNFVGTTAGILSTHGINILVNLFWGVAFNAARGIAEQVNAAINSFVSNFMTAINPQITKNYASGNYTYMNELMVRGAKYATLLYWLISLSIFIEADYILNLWLVDVPSYSVVFLRLVIIYSIFQALSNSLYIGMLATGRIKTYQLIMGSITGFSFILCYIFFKIGLGPEWSYISTIITVFVCMFARLILMEKMIAYFSGWYFFKNAIVKSFIVIILSVGIVSYAKAQIGLTGMSSFLTTCFLTLLIVPIFSYVFGFDYKERTVFAARVNEKFNHLKDGKNS